MGLHLLLALGGERRLSLCCTMVSIDRKNFWSSWDQVVIDSEINSDLLPSVCKKITLSNLTPNQQSAGTKQEQQIVNVWLPVLGLAHP